MLAVRVVLAAGFLWCEVTVGAAVATAQGGPVTPAPAQGMSDLPKRRPEEARADPMQAFDINKNGKLELAEIKSAAAARFDELNPDQDDALDVREAGPVLRAKAFGQADTNRDGTVNKAEYLAYVERMFNLANPDKDGSLSRAELGTKAGRALLALLR